MRLRIERAQGGVAAACRKAKELTVAAVAARADRMLGEASEVGLTQSEHFLVTVSKLKTRRNVVPCSSSAAVVVNDVVSDAAPMASLKPVLVWSLGVTRQLVVPVPNMKCVKYVTEVPVVGDGVG